MWARKFLIVLICLLILGCRNERGSSNPTFTPIPEDPQVVNLNPSVVVENWEYLSPRSSEAEQLFLSRNPEGIAFGQGDKAYIVWREGGFDLVWGNHFCSVQPILIIRENAIELWENDAVWNDCEDAEVAHAFRVEMETNVSPEEWTYTISPDAPPSFDQ